MIEIYSVTKEGKDLDAISVNAVLSTIYNPIVPSNQIGESLISYKRGEDHFTVSEEKGKTSLSGKISSDLIDKLKKYGLELNLGGKK